MGTGIVQLSVAIRDVSQCRALKNYVYKLRDSNNGMENRICEKIEVCVSCSRIIGQLVLLIYRISSLVNVSQFESRSSLCWEQ